MSGESPWYADGLRFACTQCGQCCRIEGHVWVDQPEIGALARLLGLDLDAFGRRYLRRVGTRLSLVEKQNRDCIFWEDGCTVYSARPAQCRTFPFWAESLRSACSWQRTAEACEGIGEGRRYEQDEIETLTHGRGETDEGDPRTPRGGFD